MIHPHIRLGFINATIGHGLIATQSIPAGTIVWCLDAMDVRLSPRQVKGLGPLYEEVLERYSWVDAGGRHVLCWDHGRYMNHSCRPNSMSPGLGFELALRDIEAGDEVVCDYGTLNLQDAFSCACGEPACRGTIYPGDFDRLATGWDQAPRQVCRAVLSVEQPLLPLVAPGERQLLDAAAADEYRLPSVLEHRYRGRRSLRRAGAVLSEYVTPMPRASAV